MKPPKKKPETARRGAGAPRTRSDVDTSAPVVSETLATSASESGLHALLAQRVRDARARRFMTRKALAEESGISLAYLARVEGGTGNISLGLLQRLSLALNLPIESFFTSDAVPNADFTLIVEFLKRQSPERLGQLRQQLFEAEAGGQRIALIGIRGVGKSTLAPL